MQTIIDVTALVCWVLLCGVACVSVCFCVGAIGLEIGRAFQ